MSHARASSIDKVKQMPAAAMTTGFGTAGPDFDGPMGVLGSRIQ